MALSHSYTPLDIPCPDCGGCAQFEDAFEFAVARSGEQRPGWHSWGGWIVREKFPSLVRWKAPRGSDQVLLRGTQPGRAQSHTGYLLMSKGVRRCACGGIGVHELTWPSDAFWRWSIRGQTLWAYNRNHAQALLGYIGADGPTRPKAPSRLPTHFLRAKVREEVVTQITRALEKHPPRVP